MSHINPFRAIATSLAILAVLAGVAGIVFLAIILIVALIESYGWGALLTPVVLVIIGLIIVGARKLFELIGRTWSRAERRWDAKHRETVPSSELIPEFPAEGDVR